MQNPSSLLSVISLCVCFWFFFWGFGFSSLLAKNFLFSFGSKKKEERMVRVSLKRMFRVSSHPFQDSLFSFFSFEDPLLLNSSFFLFSFALSLSQQPFWLFGCCCCVFSTRSLSSLKMTSILFFLSFFLFEFCLFSFSLLSLQTFVVVFFLFLIFLVFSFTFPLLSHILLCLLGFSHLESPFSPFFSLFFSVVFDFALGFCFGFLLNFKTNSHMIVSFLT